MSKKTRTPLVLHVTGNLQKLNGAGLQAITLARNLSTCSHALAFFDDFPTIQSTSIQGFPAFRIPSASQFKRHRSVAHFLLHLRPAVIHIHGFHIGWEFIPFGRLLGIRVVLKSTLMGVDDLASIVRSRRINRVLLHLIHANNALSTPMQVANSAVIDPEKVFRIPNVFEINSAQADSASKGDIALMIGAICYRKRTHLGILFYLKHLAENQRSQLYIIGPIREAGADAEYASYCRSLIPSEFRTRVTFVGELEHASVMSHLRKAKVLLHFPAAEGLPNAVIEAMANNCVPIISPMDGVAYDLVEHGRSGFIVDPLATASISWAEIDALVASAASTERALSLFSSTSVIDQYQRFYGFAD